MSRPKAYDPEQGYMYQLLYMGAGEREYEHLDYAVDRKDRDYLVGEYRLAFRGQPCTVKSIQLPKKYWH
jgi:hypothetical protein